MLPSADLGDFLRPAVVVGLCVIGFVVTALRRAKNSQPGSHIPIRVLLARPLWWLGAWALGAPRTPARYAQFRDEAFSAWEQWLLSAPSDHGSCGGGARARRNQ
jgi:hypothetical protein